MFVVVEGTNESKNGGLIVSGKGKR